MNETITLDMNEHIEASVSVNTTIDLRPIDPPRKNNSRWSQEEQSLLAQALEAGYALRDIQILFPLRSEKAVLRKAVDLDYASQTKDGVTKFIKGVKRRDRRSKKEMRQAALPLPPSHAKYEALGTIIADNDDHKSDLSKQITVLEQLMEQAIVLLEKLRRQHEFKRTTCQV